MILFRNSMPQLDLHGEDKIGAKIKVNNFINDNYILENEEIAIIHGNGQGILKKEVLNLLKKDNRVLEYAIDIYNPGCTLVRLKKKIDKKSELCYNMGHIACKGE